MSFLEVYFNGILKQSLPIKSDLISIGRAADNDIVINNMGVSSHHAIINKQGGAFFIEDLNSTNGTYFNHQKLTAKQKISQEDAIIIGKHTLKLSDWGQTQDSEKVNIPADTADATVMISRNKATEVNSVDAQQQVCYLMVRGEATGINKLLLSENNYGIGKAKDNEIRLSGWFTPAYIAEIERIGHLFYITPLKKNKVKLNGEVINASALISPADEIKIKGLSLKFLKD